MIHLDANYLIAGVDPNSSQGADLRRWLGLGEELSTSAVAWMEFMTGPVRPQTVVAVRQMLEERIVPVGREETDLAAQFFNSIGRKRSMRYNCLIAATAVQAGARLATANSVDFQAFIPHGLELAS